MNNIGLFLISALIWGSTWLMITFQLGVVAPLVSVIYRFGLASIILFSFCLIRRKRYNFSKEEHFWIFFQGLLLFGFNYWLTYLGITKINSALAAILSTSIVYFNVIFARIFLGDPIKSEVVIGVTFGLVGIVLIFIPEISFNENGSDTWEGIWIVLAACVFASLGNIVSAKTQRKKIPVIQANSLGMAYASLFLACIALMNGLSFDFEFSYSYVGSLFYLALFGSVIAFGSFLTLVGRIGPDKAGYITLVYPVVALVISTLYENYDWSISSLLGVLIILLGNFIAMRKYKHLPFLKKKAYLN